MRALLVYSQSAPSSSAMRSSLQTSSKLLSLRINMHFTTSKSSKIYLYIVNICTYIRFQGLFLLKPQPRGNFHYFYLFLRDSPMVFSLRYNLRSFVDICTSFRWCPGRRCENVAMATSSVRSIRCTCGMVFCFKCGEEAHVPATCADMVCWAEKCKNESETANWILANTKKCPKCMTRIEKNQGCNHMVRNTFLHSLS